MSESREKALAEILFFLDEEDRIRLQAIAKLDDREELAELRWLIRARSRGQLKDLGDERISPLIDEASLPREVHVRTATLEGGPHGSGDVNRSGPRSSVPR